MPPRPTVEDVDDDDPPLPSLQVLRNAGERGPLLEEIVPTLPTQLPTQPSNPSNARGPSQSQIPRNENIVTDVTPYKKWTSIYPIYMDAKRPYGAERRIAREKAVWWPLSKDIAAAAVKIGIQCLHEATKMHPRDWENPGRVKVLWKKEGLYVYPNARTKKQLIEMLAAAVQASKPQPLPKNPDESDQSTPQVGASSSIKKRARRSKRKSPANKPPQPTPPMSSRLSQFSPALESGVLIETVKAGMNTGGAQAPGVEGGPSAGGVSKGKRKVVRVRG